MAPEVLNTVERRQEASGDASSDRELIEADLHMHEFLGLLNTHLAEVYDALHLLEQQGGNSVTRERVRGMMERQTQHIGCLVEDILEVSCIEHVKIQMRTQPVDLEETVARAVERVRSCVEGHGHQLEVTLPPEPVALDADTSWLEQMLTTLLNNAAKYMKPGGHIWVTAAVQGTDVVLRVLDSGISIDPSMLPRMTWLSTARGVLLMSNHNEE